MELPIKSLDLDLTLILWPFMLKNSPFWLNKNNSTKKSGRKFLHSDDFNNKYANMQKIRNQEGPNTEVLDFTNITCQLFIYIHLYSLMCSFPVTVHQGFCNVPVYLEQVAKAVVKGVIRPDRKLKGFLRVKPK